MKNLSKILLIVLCLSLLCVPVIASGSLEKQYVNVDGSIEITADTCSEKAFNMIIRDMISNDEVQSSDALNYIGVQPMSNILCIFGHSLEKGYLTRTTHNVYSTAPKCREEIYYYEICSRGGCDYANYELSSLIYVYCH